MATPANRPNIEHLKKQAKDLLRLYKASNQDALNRFRESLPAAQDLDDAAIVALNLKLHDAQSCIARERGFSSWANLKAFVEWRNRPENAAPPPSMRLVNLLYGGPQSQPHEERAVELIQSTPDIAADDPFLACAIGDVAALEQELESDPDFAQTTRLDAPPPDLPPEMPKNLKVAPKRKQFWPRPSLWSVTNSCLLKRPDYQDRLRRCAKLLLDAGADPNQSWTTHDDHPLSALYGAAGLNHDPVMTQMLLSAGADPNDGESLYHSMETEDLTCMRLLLEAGAKVEGAILHHMLDSRRVEGLQMLLPYVDDINDGPDFNGPPLLWAIRRRCPSDVIEALLEAGADPNVIRKDGYSALRLAALYGMTEVADLLAKHGARDELTDADLFVSACAQADRSAAEQLLAATPDLISRLDETQLRQLPELTENGPHEAVRLMIELGWPIETRGGDWEASPLNMAVFQGNAELARFLLEHGASWEAEHGFGGNVRGTLFWAAQNQPRDFGDWLGCAKALVEHGMPVPEHADRFPEPLAGYFEEVERSRTDE